MREVQIELLDETNCKIHGLETRTRRKLYDQFAFMIQSARHTPAFKMGRWDGKKNFFAIGGKTYVNLLDDILPVLLEEGYDVTLVDNRVKYDITLDTISADHFSDRQWPEGHPVAGTNVELRDYQVEIINNFLKNQAAAQEVATGAGKTLITAALSQLVETCVDDAQLTTLGYEPGTNCRSIVIVPNKGLVTQTEEDYVNLGLDVGVYFGDRKDYGKTHTICTWQSLEVIQKNFREGKSDMSLEDFTSGVMAVIVDECFDGNTMISTPDGSRKISELQAGDKIINLDETKLVLKEDTVVAVHSNLTKSDSAEMLQLEFDDGTTIDVTSNHEFLTNTGWVAAEDLTTDMDIMDINTYSKG
jgi:hypothetical protein